MAPNLGKSQLYQVLYNLTMRLKLSEQLLEKMLTLPNLAHRLIVDQH